MFRLILTLYKCVDCRYINLILIITIIIKCYTNLYNIRYNIWCIFNSKETEYKKKLLKIYKIINLNR